jgi:hypothetical protein
LPGVGEIRAAAASDKQLCPKLALQVEQYRRQARLNDVQPRRGAGERPFLDDSQEVLETPQFHVRNNVKVS